MSSASDRKSGRPPNEAMREQRREEILAAAVRLFAERGYAEADTQVLADMLGVGKGTLYRYFPSKRELFLAAVDGAMRKLKGAVDEAIEGVEEPVERIAAGMRAYLTFFADHPEYVELIIQERAQFKDRKKPTYFEHRDANSRSLAGVVRLPDCPGPLPGHSRGDESWTSWATCSTGPCSPTTSFAGTVRPQEQAADMLDIALHGVLADSERTDSGNDFRVAGDRAASKAAVRSRTWSERSPSAAVGCSDGNGMQ